MSQREYREVKGCYLRFPLPSNQFIVSGRAIDIVSRNGWSSFAQNR